MQALTCLIAITTPRESEHFFSALLRLVDKVSGKPIFNVLRIGDPCEPCKKTETPWLCSHKSDELPPWKSMKKQSKYLGVYEGNEHLNMREQWGIEADNAQMVFSKNIVNNLENAELYATYKPPDVIFMAGDPAGAGRSEFGISAAYWDKGVMVIVYLDAAVLSKGTPEEERARLVNAVKSIRESNPHFKHVPIVYIPENDPGKSTSAHPYMLKDVEGIMTMRECKDRKPGVPKRDDTTCEMKNMFEQCLTTKTVCFSEDLTSISAPSEKMKAELIKQLRSYMMDILVSKNDPDKWTVKYTGKKSGGQDDLLVSVMMLPYWRVVFLRTTDYEPYATFASQYIYNPKRALW